VKLLRSLRFRSNLMPLLLAALVLRVLIPTDVMPSDGSDGMSLRSSMCSTVPGRSELIEIPEESAKPHCDRCLLTPPFEAPYASLNFEFARSLALPLLPDHVSQVPEAPLPRAQTARAPPRA
jgi:hypothetical protein